MAHGENLPLCENYTSGKCPKSDVVLLAEHGTTQTTWYTSFKCRTCRFMFLKWNPAVVAQAKQQRLDREVGPLENDRFKGWI